MTRQAINPFSVSRIRPGAVPFVFEGGNSAEILVERLRQSNWRGQIIGPHGTGKSTLLQSLIPELKHVGRGVELHTLHDGQRRLSDKPNDWRDETQLIIDGYEQLGWPERYRIWRHLRKTGAGILITAHKSMGFPTLFETNVPGELAVRLVGDLLGENDAEISNDEIHTALKRRDGNFREALFDLYDLYERQLS